MADAENKMTVERRRKLLKSEQRQKRVVALYFRGAKVHQIAKTMGVTDRTVQRDLEKARGEWKAATARSYDDLLPEKLAEIEQIKAAAWKGWAKSLEDDVETTEETNDKGGMVRKRRRGQSGDARYLATLTKLVDTECKLRGMLDHDTGGQQAVPVVEVIVTNRQEKDQFEALTVNDFARIAGKTG